MAPDKGVGASGREPGYCTLSLRAFGSKVLQGDQGLPVGTDSDYWERAELGTWNISGFLGGDGKGVSGLQNGWRCGWHAGQACGVHGSPVSCGHSRLNLSTGIEQHQKARLCPSGQAEALRSLGSWVALSTVQAWAP